MKPIIAIRPEPGLGATMSAGRIRGLAIEGYPLFEIRPLNWEAPAPEGIDGVLLGSANAVRFAGSALGRFEGKPAYCVGETTAEAARAAGLSVAMIGAGGLQQLIEAIAERPLCLLRLAGEAHVPLALLDGITLETRIVYRAELLAMAPMMANRLRDGALVLLHSAAAARHFAQECARLAIPRSKIALAALGPRIAAAAGEGWACLRSAEHPSDPALLALAADMCH
jgi:uroporphyrinogen-III synthase